MKRLLCFLFTAGSCLPLTARAQTPPAAPPDTARVFRHELGLTASPSLQYLFSANRSLPVGLLYKRHLNERNALRLRVVGTVNTSTFRSSLDAPANHTFQNRMWYVSAFAGWESNHRMGSRWEAGYGTEIGASFGRSRNYIRESKSVGFDSLTHVESYRDFFQDRISVSTGLQARGFASLGLRVWRTVRVFAETAVVVAADWTAYKGTSLLYFPSNPVSVRDSNRSFSIRLLPVQLVGVSAKF